MLLCPLVLPALGLYGVAAVSGCMCGDTALDISIRLFGRVEKYILGGI